jgi:plastocyanin
MASRFTPANGRIARPLARLPGLAPGGLRSGLLAIVLLLVAAAAAGCGPSTPGPTASLGAGEADATITSRDSSFTVATITVGAGEPFTLRLINDDGVPHNVAIYVDNSATDSLFIGELITNATVDYAVPALEGGTYFFRCDLHPEMTGTLVVEG